MLKVTSVTVEEKKKFANEQALIVGGEKDKVDAQAAIAGAESIKCAKIASDVQELMTNVQADLDKALPALALRDGASARVLDDALQRPHVLLQDIRGWHRQQHQ